MSEKNQDDSSDELQQKAAEAALRLVPDAPGNAWEDLGAGNRKKMRLDRLGQELADNVIEIQSKYDGLTHQDSNAFKIQHALFSIAHMATSGGTNIERYVAGIVGEVPDKDRKNAAVRSYDSLAMLENAFNFVTPNVSGQRSEEHIEQFTDNFPTPLWQDNQLKEETLEAIDKSHQIIGTLSSPNQESILGFVKKMRIELLNSIGYAPLPRHGRTANQNSARQRAISNLKTLAWQDWEHSLPEADR
jgi:hypothetical protein